MDNEKNSTIIIGRTTREKLKSLKRHGENYDELLNRLILFKESKKNEPLNKEELYRILYG